MEIEQSFCPSLSQASQVSYPPGQSFHWIFFFFFPKASGYATTSPGLQHRALVPSELLLIYKYLVIKTYNMIGNTSCVDSSE